jgi:hypothetical protein
MDYVTQKGEIPFRGRFKDIRQCINTLVYLLGESLETIVYSAKVSTYEFVKIQGELPACFVLIKILISCFATKVSIY